MRLNTKTIQNHKLKHQNRNEINHKISQGKRTDAVDASICNNRKRLFAERNTFSCENTIKNGKSGRVTSAKIEPLNKQGDETLFRLSVEYKKHAPKFVFAKQSATDSLYNTLRQKWESPPQIKSSHPIWNQSIEKNRINILIYTIIATICLNSITAHNEIQ